MQSDRYPDLAMWIASVALFCAAGIAVFMTWMPTAVGNLEDHATLGGSPRIPAQPAGARVDKDSAGAVSRASTGTTCTECGVIESVWERAVRSEAAAESTRSYEVTIRFRDGSTRVFSEATPRMWRSGAAVKIID
jgi:uncharacterized iron-regulated membrane protein